MRDLEKREGGKPGGRRENKIKNTHTINRIQRDLIKTQKQLKQEMHTLYKMNKLTPEIEAECQELCAQVTNYFEE